MSRRGVVLTLVVLGFALYAWNLRNPLFWDDTDWIVDNPAVHRVSPDNLRFLFSHDVLAGIRQHSNYYRPVLMLSFLANWAAAGPAPLGYHLLSNGLHLANAALLFLLLDRLLGKRAVAAITALLWLVHPVQVEAVAYVSGRGDPLSVFFMLASLSLWLRPGRWRKAGALACAAAAILSRETAVLLPVYVTLTLMAFVHVQPFWRSLRAALREGWPLYLIALGAIGLRAAVLASVAAAPWHRQASAYTEHAAYRLWTFLGALAVYLKLAVAPLGLHMERTVPVLTSPLAWPIPIVLALLALAGWWTARAWSRGDRLWCWGVGMFLIPLLPASGILLPINALIYEHWLYLSLAGFLAIAAAHAVRAHAWLRSRSDALSAAVVAAGIAYAAFLCVQTVRRNLIWGEPERLYLETLSHVPDDVRALNNLANLYLDRGDRVKGEIYLRRAIAASPVQAAPYYNLGNLYKGQGQLDDAIALYRTAIARDPAYHFAYRNLADACARRGDLSCSLSALVSLHPLAPDDPAVYFATAQVLAAMGRREEARSVLTAGLPFAHTSGPQQEAAFADLMRVLR